MSDARRSSDLTLEWEKVDRALGDGLEDMLAAHWQEVALDQESVPLAPDWARYRQLERQGVLRSLAMRKAGRLIGYNVFFVQPPIHYMRQRWALNDVLYLDPAHRKGLAGARLVTGAEEPLRKLGVSKVIYHTKPHVLLGHAQKHGLGDLLGRLRYRLIEEVWAKNLRPDSDAP